MTVPVTQTAEIATPTSVDATGPGVAPRANDREPELHIEIPEPETESEDSDDSDDSFATASESESDSDSEDEEQDEIARQQEREAREAERQRVLEAAGLIVKKEAQPPPRPARRASQRRKPAPAVPERSPRVPHKDLPPLPELDLSVESGQPAKRLMSKLGL